MEKLAKRYRRHKRVRAKIIGTAKVPRLCVFRSSTHIYVQLIDDDKGKTILSVSEKELKNTKAKTQKPKLQPKTKNLKEKKVKETKTGKIAVAYEIGKMLAEKALENKISKIVFDRGGYKYHGRVRAIAEGARDAGLVF